MFKRFAVIHEQLTGHPAATNSKLETKSDSRQDAKLGLQVDARVL